MKLLLDAGLPHRACGLLVDRGHDVIHANDIQIGAEDEFLLETAAKQSRIIVTLDADFHQLLALKKATTPSVIRLRLESLRHEEADELIHRILVVCKDELERGAVISANRRMIRVRQLPIG